MALSHDQKVELLQTVDLFTGLAPDTLGRVAEVAHEVSYPAGRWIVRQGEVGTGFFLLLAGRTRVVRDDEQLAELGPGDFFGELSLLDQQPRVASVVTTEATECLAIASWDFDALLESQPALTLALLRGVARRLRSADVHHQP
ncbi:MAG: Crp/Fnr family transcriptional regulator [Chloroflexota bacterium]